MGFKILNKDDMRRVFDRLISSAKYEGNGCGREIKEALIKGINKEVGDVVSTRISDAVRYAIRDELGEIAAELGIVDSPVELIHEEEEELEQSGTLEEKAESELDLEE
jgi:hypothetical protein